MIQASKRENNEYDWTISYSMTSASLIDIKSYNNLLLKVNYLLISIESRTCGCP